MLTLHPNYITDKTGKNISVVIPIKDFEAIMEELEEIKLDKEAKKSKPKKKASMDLLEDLKDAAEQVRLHKKGKLKLKTAQELLDEL
jgi:PHD/YefM family antitoxin component YafN of YafNO toxin-antitoxin module